MFNAERYRNQREALKRALVALTEANAASSARTASNRLNEVENLVATWFFDLDDDAEREHTEAIQRVYNLWATQYHQSRETFTCDSCMVVYPVEFRLYDENCNRDYCPHCALEGYDSNYRNRSFLRDEPEPEYDDEEDEMEDEDDRREGYINQHTASPIRVLNKNYTLADGETFTKGMRLFGFESEFVCESISNAKRVAGDLPTTAILKYDGSLPHGGAELCTLPFSRKAAYVEIPRLSEAMLKHGARAWNREQCGLHIHVSRDSASWLTWGKVDRFFENRANREFLDLVAGRKGNSYCKRDGYSRIASHKLKSAREKNDNGFDRYQALNFSTNKPTVEFRLFRGNVSSDGILRCMEFCDSLIEWARTCSAASTMPAIEYLKWLFDNSKSYPLLSKYLKIGKIIDDMNVAA